MSVSNLHLQIGLGEAWKPCWNLLSLNPRLNLVICFIPLLLKQLHVLLTRRGTYLLTFKVLTLSELIIDRSKFFHSITAEGKNNF